ncbi:MAG TPA: NUDIX hydrolase [Candidatus Onthoplasma faecipullorum]|nr:NUDIX hydrolase [Candidatus Onthoplasma faecipullorum]
MKDYEKLSESCQITWRENFSLEDKKYTQVSAYVFNDENQLLIVKNGNTWTIPGGHPEAGETKLETLSRELMEEACLTIKDVQYLGAVEVQEDGKNYYQLRYFAKVDKILPFVQEWEINERKFVDLENLSEYITWSTGKTFTAQINSAKKLLNNISTIKK